MHDEASYPLNSVWSNAVCQRVTVRTHVPCLQSVLVKRVQGLHSMRE